MKTSNLVTIGAGGYAFSRSITAALIWLALILQRREILFIVLLILLLSVLLMIQRSPLVMLYKVTIERIWPSRPVEVDAKGLRFANGLGLLLSVVCLVILYFGIPMVGWILTGFFAVFKTVSALGYCPGLKLYDLIRSDK